SGGSSPGWRGAPKTRTVLSGPAYRAVSPHRASHRLILSSVPGSSDCCTLAYRPLSSPIAATGRSPQEAPQNVLGNCGSVFSSGDQYGNCDSSFSPPSKPKVSLGPILETRVCDATSGADLPTRGCGLWSWAWRRTCCRSALCSPRQDRQAQPGAHGRELLIRGSQELPRGHGGRLQ